MLKPYAASNFPQKVDYVVLALVIGSLLLVGYWAYTGIFGHFVE